MSGNTKLLGFGVGSKVTLQRWGKKCNVTISPDSWEGLRHACSAVLPMEPKKQPDRYSDTFVASYDEATGRIQIDLDLDSARELYAILEAFYSPNSKDTREMLHKWKEAIEDVIKAHHDYHDLREPGVG